VTLHKGIYWNLNIELQDFMTCKLCGSNQLDQAYRQLLIDKIYETLNWVEAFLYFEKVRAPRCEVSKIS